MSDKIRKLCIEAILEVDSIGNPDTQKMYIPDCFRDKFAELLVRAIAEFDSEENNPDHQPGDCNQTILGFLNHD